MTPVIRLASILMLVSLGLGAATTPPISGDYIEVRSHHVYTCGCLYSGEQATGGREAILTWVIQKGEFQGVPLAGLKAVAVVLGQANLGLDETLRKSVVFVVNDGEAHRKAIEGGIAEGGWVQVLGGVAPGDQVIIGGLGRLKDGMPVAVAPSPAPAGKPTSNPAEARR